MVRDDAVLSEIEELASKVREAEAAYSRLLEERAELFRRARGEGFFPREIAERAGVSRQMVERVLGRTPKKDK
ncbi:hypothetical protein SAMN05421878_1099 [Actinobaculum suis]|uniref:Uncharacterized protein n=1 Tax=Actinobaculum suis TaxID=1657 RepID=A0A1G7CWW0_9ACTO|nr:hypothetical protein [Actinobaculum suis]MDY5152761.1 hypothetical protein [Actinobaculum suis]SDE43779.1 hypothetical protein SAMN05421878_1099 [Actinobaculum suis]